MRLSRCCLAVISQRRNLSRNNCSLYRVLWRRYLQTRVRLHNSIAPSALQGRWPLLPAGDFPHEQAPDLAITHPNATAKSPSCSTPKMSMAHTVEES
jgi:hypothetical protein